MFPQAPTPAEHRLVERASYELVIHDLLGPCRTRNSRRQDRTDRRLYSTKCHKRFSHYLLALTKRGNPASPRVARKIQDPLAISTFFLRERLVAVPCCSVDEANSGPKQERPADPD